MDVQRAHMLGLRADDCRIRAQSGRYGGEWVVFAFGRPITQSRNLFAMCWFVADLRRMSDF